jgi:hypothetical protein
MNNNPNFHYRLLITTPISFFTILTFLAPDLTRHDLSRLERAAILQNLASDGQTPALFFPDDTPDPPAQLTAMHDNYAATSYFE